MSGRMRKASLHESKKPWEKDASERTITPWSRQILTGYDLLRSPNYNKGMAFTGKERKQLKLRGLLPPAEVSQDFQITKILKEFHQKPTNLDKYKFLASLFDRHEALFYRILVDNMKEMMPIVYTPTVGQACQNFGYIYHNPRGLYITMEDKGEVLQVLKNWPVKNVRAIVVTDGERILGLGDLGTFGMGIPIGKLSLYTACAGIPHSQCLPICLDVGTNNQTLLDDPYYTGLRRTRERGKSYDDLVDEFVWACKLRFGHNVLIQFEDFANINAFRLLKKYQPVACTFNDDIQGTAAVSLAGIIAAMRITKNKLGDNRILFYGAGSAGIGISELIATAIAQEEGCTLEEGRTRIHLVDSRGLIVKDRSTGGLNAEKEPYAHPHKEIKDLLEIVHDLKPTILVGVSARPGVFTKEVCEAMASYNERPVIFALSNPTSKAEVTAPNAYAWTNGKCVYSSGSPFDPVTIGDQTFVPGQGNNSYIFPGVALGVIATGSLRVTEEMFLAAANCLAGQVHEEDLQNGTVFPPMETLRIISAKIAVEVAKIVKRENFQCVNPFPEDDDLLTFMLNYQETFEYRPFTSE